MDNATNALETENTPQELPRKALLRIESEMKGWSDTLHSGQLSSVDTFRYESFARRLVAAEYGRQDAVIWAWDWYCNLIAEDEKKSLQRQQSAIDHEEIKRGAREEMEQGRSDNPRLQAFLNTLENPAEEMYHPDGTFQGWKYMVWIGPIIGSFERRKGLPDCSVMRRKMFDCELNALALMQRAARLGGPVPTV